MPADPAADRAADGAADRAAEIVGLLDRLAGSGRAAAPAPAALERELAGRWEASPALVEPVVERWLGAAVAEAAGRGWRRVDVERAMAAKAPVPPGDLIAELARDGIGPWRQRHRLAPAAAVPMVVLARRLLTWLGTIPVVADDDGDEHDGVDPVVLAKVRALLAKAESTTFEAEADALMAKAHQLMVRHAIDQVVLDGDGDGDGDGAGAGRVAEVTARRVFIDDPYQRAKYLLLAEVARASSCRALLSTGFGMATVFGHAADLDAVELLYTSLLVQATAGVVGARPSGDRAPAQVAAYRRAWLVAFAQRIGERLRLASSAAVHEAAAELGPGLLPVLAAREDAVEAALRAAAPRVRTLRTNVSSGEGWHDGTAAGDRATLGTVAPLPRRPGALGRG